METIVLGSVVGILSSLVASAMFLLAISTLKPTIDVSSAIAKRTDADGNTTYAVKIINRTRSPIASVRVRVYIASPRTVRGGRIYRLKPVELNQPEVMEIPGFDRNDKQARYARRFLFAEDLDAHWPRDDSSSVRFQIYAVHALTGFGKAVEQEYEDKDSQLVRGDFKYGNSLEIIEARADS